MKKRSYLVLAVLLACSSPQKEQSEGVVVKSSESKEQTFGFKEKIIHSKAMDFFEVLPRVAESKANPITDEKVLLGKMLYMDTRLSKDGNISCNSCHNLNTGGVDNLPTSPGDKGEHGERNSPTVLNAALHIAQFWDGRAKDVEEQAGMPILNPGEMAIPSERFLMNRLSKVKEYQKMFKGAFTETEQPLTYKNLTFAIAAFERTLLTPSRFDAFLSGDLAALNDDEVAGLNTFMDVGCVTCHSGVAIGGGMYQKFPKYGEMADYIKSEKEDLGRAAVTGNDIENYMFKVPSLREVGKTAPYFHNGSVDGLNETVKIMAKSQLDKELAEDDVTSIVAFLNSLSGELPDEI